MLSNSHSLTPEYFMQHLQRNHPELEINAACAGWAVAVMFDFLGNEDLNEMIGYIAKHDPYSLNKKLHALETSPLDKKEKKLEDGRVLNKIKLLFEMVVIYSNPKPIGDLKGVSQPMIDKITQYMQTKYKNSLSESFFTKKNIGHFPVMIKQGSTHQSRYAKFLNDIMEKANQASCRVSIILDNLEHRFVLNCDGVSKQWYVGDILHINKLNTPIVGAGDTLIPHIFSSLRESPADDRIGFETTVFTTSEHAEQFEECFANTKQLSIDSTFETTDPMCLRETPRGVTMFHLVAKFGEVGFEEQIFDMTKKDASLLQRCTTKNQTPVNIAIEQNQDEVVKKFLELKADSNAAIPPDGETSLIVAAKEGHLEVVKKLIAAHANLDAKMSDGRTALILAFENKKDEVAKILIEAKADLEVNDNKGNTPLLTVAQRGQFTLVAKLIESKAFLEAKNEEGNTPLLEAVECGKFPIVAKLIESKAFLEAKNMKGNTPLLAAAQRGQFTVVAKLIKAKANINEKYASGYTPLLMAVVNGYYLIAEKLIEAKANLEAKYPNGYTPLLMTVVNEYFPIAKKIIEAKANLEAKYPNGNTPLLVAVVNGYFPIAEKLIEANANLEAKYPHGRTPLLMALKCNFPIAEKLIEAKANIEVNDEDGNTPLIVAAQRGQFKVVAKLIGARALLEAKNEEGNTPLLEAVECDKFPIVAKLIEAKAFLEAENKEGNTPLLAAAQKGHFPLVAKLIEAKALLEAKNAEGNTPLLAAVQRGVVDFNLVAKLINSNANPNVGNRFGETPLSAAVQAGDFKLITIILKTHAISIQDIQATISIAHERNKVVGLEKFLTVTSQYYQKKEAVDQKTCLSQEKLRPIFSLLEKEYIIIAMEEKDDCDKYHSILGELIECVNQCMFNNRPLSDLAIALDKSIHATQTSFHMFQSKTTAVLKEALSNVILQLSESEQINYQSKKIQS